MCPLVDYDAVLVILQEGVQQASLFSLVLKQSALRYSVPTLLHLPIRNLSHHIVLVAPTILELRPFHRCVRYGIVT